MRLMSAFACVFPWAGVNAGMSAGNVVWSGVLVNLKVGVASRSHNLREGRDLRPGEEASRRNAECRPIDAERPLMTATCSTTWLALAQAVAVSAVSASLALR